MNTEQMNTKPGSGDITVKEGSQIFTWTISNFSDLQDKALTEISSPKFSVKDFNNRTSDCVIRMRIHQNKDGSEHLSAGMCNVDDTPLILNCRRLSIQDKNEKNKYDKLTECHVLCNEDGFVFGSKMFISMEKNDRETSLLLPDGNFTLVVKLIKPVVQCPTSVCTLPGDLTDYLDDDLSDVKIVCNGKEFGCHRLILSLNSPVFKAMLRSNFKESTRGEIVLDSADPDILKEFLSFLYCGKIKNLRGNGIELLKLADQYQVDNLKVICGLSLTASRNLSTIVELLIMAFSHNESHLKKGAINFVVKNINVLMKTPSWKNSFAEYPEIMFEIMQALVDKNH